MTQALAVLHSSFTPDQLDLIKRTVARGASDDELKLFLYRCSNLGLDPLKPGMIHFVKYGNGPGSIVVGIEGFRSKAVKTGKLSGIKRGAIKDDKGVLVGAWAEVFRKDWQHCAREEVPLSEYNKGSGPWKTMPETMIKKVAEAAALRMAFPDDLGGIYAPEEMDQAAGRVVGEQPAEGDGHIPSDTGKIMFGQWKGRSVDEVLTVFGPKKVADYIAYLEEPAQVAKRKPEHVGPVADFIERASDAIAAFENAAAEGLKS
jgi:phage recombination protein Bet